MCIYIYTYDICFVATEMLFAPQERSGQDAAGWGANPLANNTRNSNRDPERDGHTVNMICSPNFWYLWIFMATSILWEKMNEDHFFTEKLNGSWTYFEWQNHSYMHPFGMEPVPKMDRQLQPIQASRTHSLICFLINITVSLMVPWKRTRMRMMILLKTIRHTAPWFCSFDFLKRVC